jgi:HlyD family type I secretion membrane fusion protein
MEEKKILNTNPVKIVVAGVVVILIFFGGIAAWSVYFPFQGAVIAPGTVMVAGKKRMVQHLEGGIIDEILVKEGSRVETGDVLIRLKDTRVISSVDLFQGMLWAKTAEAARLTAEMGMKDQIEWPRMLLDIKDKEDIQDILSKEQDIFEFRRRDLKGKVSLYNSQIIQLEERIDGAKEELTAYAGVISKLDEELAATRPLLADKFMGKTRVLELERQFFEAEGKRGSLKQSIAEYRQKIEEFKLNIVDLKNQYREKAVSNLGQVKDTIFELREKIRPMLDAKVRLEVRAPISGTIINRQVNSESGVIRAGMPLMEIVPEPWELTIYAQIRPTDITRIQVGQPTNVQLTAFERYLVPPVTGEVVYISSDLVSKENDRGQVSYYEVHVKVSQKDLETSNAYLSPGMPVACYITTDKRSIISYLLNPLLKNVDRAMRE